MKRFQSTMFVLLLVSFILGTVLFIGILFSKELKVTERKIPLVGIDQEVRIILLSDLHGTKFGPDNSDLISLIQQQSPDLICLAGDIISRDSTSDDIHSMCTLMEHLTQICPVYFSLGNHEMDFMDAQGAQVLEDFSASGAILLEDSYLDLTVNQSSFRLGGMSKLAYRDGSEQFQPGVEAFLTEFCKTDLPTVLLSHRPEAFSFRKACSEWDVDLILSGHTHGGLVRLPLVGGVIAPIQGWFPDVDYGEYTLYNSKMIVTSGLAGYNPFPRVFNPPEICLIKLVPPATESH